VVKLIRQSCIVQPCLESLERYGQKSDNAIVEDNFKQIQNTLDSIYKENKYLRAIICELMDKVNFCEDCPDRYKQLAGECQYCGRLDSIVGAKYGI